MREPDHSEYETIRLLRAELAEANGNSSALRARVSQAENHASIAKEKYTKEHHDAQELVSQLEAMEKDLDDAQAEIAILKRTALGLDGRLQEKSEWAKKMRQSYEDEVAVLKDRIKDLEIGWDK